MIGAIAGGMVGSLFEFADCDIDFSTVELFPRTQMGALPSPAGLTGGALMALAITQAALDAGGDTEVAPRLFEDRMRWFAATYPVQRSGYGGLFLRWLTADDPKPYNSYGTGAAARVAAIGWLFPTLETTEQWAQSSAAVTHNHPDGIKGAQAVAAAIWLGRTGQPKSRIRHYLEARFGYDLSISWDRVIGSGSSGNVCQRIVAEAVLAVLNAEDFESCIRLAVSLGGDTSSRAAIAGSMAEPLFGVPDRVRTSILRTVLPTDLAAVVRKFELETIAERLVAVFAPVYERIGPYPKTPWIPRRPNGRIIDGQPVMVERHRDYGEATGLDEFFARYADLGFLESRYRRPEYLPGSNEQDIFERVALADPSELLAFLAFLVRGEYWCDGALAASRDDGSLRAVADRAFELAGLSDISEGAASRGE